MALALGLCLLGCGEPRPGPYPDADTIQAQPSAMIGELEGASEYLFGRIVGVAVDSAGTIYVADDIGSSVRAYDQAGEYLGTVGSEGEGPGEFSYLLGVDIDASGDLLVRGAFRVSVFSRSGEGAFADSLVRTTPVEGARADRGVRGRMSASRFYGPSYAWEGFQRRGYYYLVYDASGVITDTIAVPPFPDPESTGRANYPVNAQGFGVNVDGINRAPFEPRPTWDITDDGHVVFSRGDRYEIVEVGPEGDTVRTIRRAVEDVPIPDAERRDSAQAFNARLDSVPVPINEVRGMSAMARRRELPATLPPVVMVQVDRARNVWVRRWPSAEVAETVFDVFDPTGLHVRTVRVPVSLRQQPAPWVAGQVIAGVVEDSGTGIERVAVFRLP